MPVVDIKGVGKAQFPDGMSVDTIRAFLKRKYSQDAVEGKSNILEPMADTASPYQPTLTERLGQGISDTLYDTGIISNRYGAQSIGSNLASIGEMLPGIGDATAGDEFGSALAQGDYTGMALGAFGVIPVAGDLAKKLTRVTHGSNDAGFTGEIVKGGEGNIFDGIFASHGDVSDYGGIKQISYDIEDSKMMGMGDADVDYDDAIKFIKDEYPDADEDTIDAMYEIIAEDANVFEMSVNPFESYGYDDLGEASWQGQKLRGMLAKRQGFDAVEMNDEFGVSVLIPHGSNAKQVTQ